MRVDTKKTPAPDYAIWLCAVCQRFAACKHDGGGVYRCRACADKAEAPLKISVDDILSGDLDGLFGGAR